jgi:hypothetical protein
MVAACKDVLTGELVPRAMLHASPHVYFFGSPCYLILSVI